ncbi:MAG: hypothetical protein PHU66_06485 [Bacteroidaceae bacterium]|nr:hypothetical protein [Bacteroidaceae bacterium]
MKKIYFIIIAVLFNTITHGQKNDFVTILKELPPVADNVLITEKEKKVYTDKLSEIHPLLLDYKSKFSSIKEKEYTPSEYNAIENVLKEYESIYDKHIVKINENLLVKWSEIHNNNMELMAGVIKTNMPYYEQIRVLIGKPKSAETDKLIKSLRKKVYDNKLLIYPKMQNDMGDLLKQTFEEMIGAAHYVNKLDSISLNVIKLPTDGVGPTLIENYIRILQETFSLYNLGPFEEYFNDSWNLDHTFIGFPR